MESMGLDPHFWANKKVFITGHTGFKGGWLSLWLTQLGAKVSGYSLEPPTSPSLFNEAVVAKHLSHDFRGNICDLSHLKRAMDETKPELVIHMAAQSLVQESYRDPVTTYSTNVMGTVNLFEAVRSCPSVSVVLNITTDKCYENDDRLQGYKEKDPMGGYDPYSSSKG